jgi:hypothetical protein
LCVRRLAIVAVATATAATASTSAAFATERREGFARAANVSRFGIRIVVRDDSEAGSFVIQFRCRRSSMRRIAATAFVARRRFRSCLLGAFLGARRCFAGFLRGARFVSSTAAAAATSRLPALSVCVVLVPWLCSMRLCDRRFCGCFRLCGTRAEHNLWRILWRGSRRRSCRLLLGCGGLATARGALLLLWFRGAFALCGLRLGLRHLRARSLARLARRRLARRFVVEDVGPEVAHVRRILGARVGCAKDVMAQEQDPVRRIPLGAT